MKRLIPLFLFFFILTAFFDSQAQTVATYKKKWLFGMNWGGAWENADVHSRLGTGWGLTLEKEIIANNTSVFGFSLRGRYLHTWMWGRDYKPFYGVNVDENLNGVAYPSIDYTSQGFVYRNFYTKTDEFSLEGLLILNKLRAHSGFKIYGFGGIGATGYQTKINQLDGTNTMYDYSSVSTFSKSLTKQDLNTLWDNTYETNGVAGRTRTSYVLSGAIGVGIGIKLSPNVYLGWEHKYTYTSTDMLDASRWNNNSTPSLKNDRYHYSNLFLTVAIGAGTAQSNSQPPTQTTYHPTTPVGVYKPEITLKYPNQNPVTFGDCVADIRLAITNVSSINQITVLADGNPLNSSAYSFDYGSSILSIRTMLAGNTTFTIIAENESGRDTKYVYANCAAVTTPTTPVLRPQISIVSAVGYNCIANVAASIKNITDYRSIQVLMDGRTLASNQFTYDSYNGILKIAVPFTASTTITIRVNDSGYTVENSVTVTCDVVPPVVVPTQTPPTIEVTNSQVAKSGTGCTAQITATVLGVSLIKDITVTCNGVTLSGTAYTFNPNIATLNINYPIAGTNTFLIKARNAGGEVNSTVSLSCVNQPIVLPPSIILVYPATTSTVSNTCKEHIVVKIPNVTTIQAIDVRVNGVSMNKAALAFDVNTGVLAFDAVITNQTQIDIHASNTGGNADQSLVITCKPVVAPTIQISYPTTEPFVSTTCSETVVATVKGVSSKSSIHVTQNGQVLTAGIVYDVNTGKLTIPVSITDRSELVINAIGDGGSVSKSLTLICQPAPKPVITVITPSENPVVSALCTESITVQIQNISSVNDLSVKLNGTEIAKSQLAYNTASGILVFPVTFTGTATVVIQATNTSGVVSQSISLQCKPIVIPKPVIKQITPVGANTISKTCHEPVQLQVTNCDAVSNITVLVDGAALATEVLSFDAGTGMLSFQVAVKTQTSVVVTAKNKGGVATTTLSFQCKPTVQPSVSVLQPIGAPFVSTSCSENFTLAVTNVSDINQIDVLYNNVSIDRNLLKYDTLTNKLTFNYAFTGNGNLLVKAKNEAGEDSKTIQLQCKPVLAPELVIVKPAVDPLVSETCRDTVVASVKNITSADNIKVYANNVAVVASDVLFDNASGTIRVINNYTGDREIKIVVTNEAGSVTKLAHLTCAPVLQPTVTLVNPVTDNFTSTTCQENVLMTLTNITSIDQIAVKINSVLIDKSKYTFAPANGLLTIPVAVTTESVVEVVATNKTKTATKTCKIVCNKIPLPTIKITGPASAVLDDCNTIASALLTDITSKDQIVITVNGTPLATTAFTFENNIVSFPLTVKSRSEVILIVTNTTGSATIKRTLVCNLSQVVTGPTGTCENTQKTSITNCTTCNDTIEASNGDINVPANKKVCITKPFNGNVNMNGGQLVICSNATIHNINFNSGDIVVNGTATFDNLNMNSSASAIRNYGTVQFSNITFNGRFENHGQATVTSDFNVNSGATFINTGTFNAKQSFNNNKYVCNSGTINVAGNLKDNGSAEFVNSCKLIVGGDLHIDQVFQNSGAVRVGANTVLNGSGKLTLASNSKWITNAMMMNGTISGPSQSCASITITSQTTINSSASVAGKVDICDANGIETNTGSLAATVTTDCSCSINMTGSCGINDDLNVTLTICHKPAGDPANIQSLIIPKSALAEHLAHGDHVGGCTDADKPVVVPPVVTPPVEEEKVTICHKPPGNPTNVQTITVAKSALAAHLAHGDHVGECTDADKPVVVPPVVTPPVEEEKVTICHKPPGNPTNVQTITVAKSALAAHLAHGDHVGECTDADKPVVVPPVVTPPVEEEKVTICHKPPGNPTNVQTITVAKSALAAHLAHGDHVGECTDADKPVVVPPVVTPPVEEEKVTICHKPPGNPTNVQTITVAKSALAAHLAHGDHVGECTDADKPVVVPPVVTPPVEEEKVTICHKPPGNPTNVQTITVAKSALAAHLAHGDHVGECTDADKPIVVPPVVTPPVEEEKVTICHKPPGNPDNVQTITVAKSALAAHLAHGDHVGECTDADKPVVAPPVVVPPVGIPPAEDEKVTICHKPPGNPTNIQTLTISKSALSAHLAHGDHVGECTDDEINKIKEDQLKKQQEEQQKQQQQLEEQKQLQQQQEQQRQQQLLEQQKQQEEQQKQQQLLEQQKQQQEQQKQQLEQQKQQQLLEQQKQQEEQQKQQQLLEQQKQQQLLEQQQKEAEQKKLEEQKQQQLLEQQKQQEEQQKQQQLLEQQKQQQLLEQQQKEAEQKKQQELLEQQKQQQLLEQQKQQQILEQQKKEAEQKKLEDQKKQEEQKKLDEQKQQQQQEEQQVTICHKPTDGGRAQTIKVPASQLNKHLSHGDHVGVCTPEEGQ